MSSIRIVASNPWGSLRAWLDDDGETVYLNLGAPEEAVPSGEYLVYQSVWVRNDGPAPESVDPAPAAEGERLPQPRRHTRHPDGKPLGKGQVLELLWFEEGDGVALMIDGALEAVLPSWSGAEVRGYAVEARGRGPVAWELGHPNPLQSRAARARAHWDALNHGGLWQLVESADLAFLEQRIGKREWVWSVTPPGEPPRRVASFRPTPPRGRVTTVFATVGMALQPMPRVEAEREEHNALRRAQIAFATVGAEDWVPTLLGELSRYPWRAVTWIGDLHLIEAPNIDPVTAPGRFPAALLMAAPGPDGLMADAATAPDLSGQTERSGDPVNWLWVVPITDGERALAEAEGTEALAAKLRAAGIGWVHDPTRAAIV